MGTNALGGHVSDHRWIRYECVIDGVPGAKPPWPRKAIPKEWVELAATKVDEVMATANNIDEFNERLSLIAGCFKIPR